MKENDLVLCKVEKVTNTITSVRLPNNKEGTIVSSEIAPGRIKLMRQYVTQNKQIVCKILKIDGNQIHLSLRRVNSKERKEVMHTFKQSQAIDTAFKQILGDKREAIEKKILENFSSLAEFVSSARDDESLILKYIPKNNQDAIRKVTDKKREKAELKQNIKIKCIEGDGVQRIKKIFSLNNDNLSITYISAGNFKMKLIVKDFKEGKKEMAEILKELEKRAKENNCEFYSNEDK